MRGGFMKEYIESIIEIILEDVSCVHQEIEEFPHGPKHDDPTYCLNDPLAVIEKCIEAIPARLIERPEITDEFMEKKTSELITMISDLYPYEGSPCIIPKSKAKEFLSSLLNELAAKINLIGKEGS